MHFRGHEAAERPGAALSSLAASPIAPLAEARVLSNLARTGDACINRRPPRRRRRWLADDLSRRDNDRLREVSA